MNIRLLDPPLHEFVPHDLAGQETMAKEMGVSVEDIKRRVDSLAENNPMLGHRGCRLGITFPEITAMQTRAIMSAACELKKEGKNPMPEVMVPLIVRYELMQGRIQETDIHGITVHSLEDTLEVSLLVREKLGKSLLTTLSVLRKNHLAHSDNLLILKERKSVV